MSKKGLVGPKASEEYSVEDMIIKVADNNAYLFVPEYCKNYQIGDYAYSSEYEFNEDENTYEFGDFSITNSYGFSESSDINGLIQDLFYDAFSFNSDWVSSEKQSNGGYKLSLNVDVKEILDDIKDAFVENLENPFIDVVNDLLAVFYSDLTVESLVTDLKEAIDEESTIQDLFDFIETKLNLRLSNTFNFIFSMLSDGEFDGYDFDENFYSYFDIADDAAFAEMLDGVVAALSGDDYTIQEILDALELYDNGDDTVESYLESVPSFMLALVEIYEEISDVEINNFNINFAIVTNLEVNEISNFILAIQGEVCGEDYTVNYDLDLDFKISDIGTTQISLPDSFEVYEIELGCYIETELTENVEYVYEDIDFGDTDLSFETGVCYLNYDATEKTLTLSDKTVNYLLSIKHITFEKDDDFIITFYYTFGVVE